MTIINCDLKSQPILGNHNYSLFTIHYSLFTIHYSLFTIRYSIIEFT